MKTHTIISLTLLASAIINCSAKEQKPPEAPTQPASISAEAADRGDEDPNKAAVSIDPRLVEMCNIPVPEFPFDSSALSRDASAVLDALGTCLVSGPAQGRALRLIGHTDPRGTDEYNLALGHRRAASVAGHLESRSVAMSRLETSSRGESDAVGTDESSWARDRKVEILLAD